MTDFSFDALVEHLYKQLPNYQRDGINTGKIDLSNITRLCKVLDEPQDDFPSIHIAGTNGKGTVTHMIAAILQASGYKVGCYTSPHYVDFRERIKINGEYIDKESVIQFVNQYESSWTAIQPSFFEITVALAFWYFAKQQVDVAVIETGLGGRLDSTNIIRPLISVITNIGLEHQAYLGDTIPEIAQEKAGIIKSGIPAIIGEKNQLTTPVFVSHSITKKAPLYFAKDLCQIKTADSNEELSLQILDYQIDSVEAKTNSPFFIVNLNTACATIPILQRHFANLTEQAIREAILHFPTLTNYKGRWQILNRQPLVIADSGHNKHAWAKSIPFIQSMTYEKMHMVIGFANDKNPKLFFEYVTSDNCKLYLCSSTFRGTAVSILSSIANEYQLDHSTYSSVAEAIEAAMKTATKEDIIFIGGSSFVVGDALTSDPFRDFIH